MDVVSRRPVVERRLLRFAAPALFVAVLGAFMWRDGVPVARDRLLMWIVLGLLAVSTTNLGGWLRSVVLEWLPFALVLWAYDLLRGSADELFAAHYAPQIEADRLLFGGIVPTTWLQDHLWHGTSRLQWYDFAAWAVYMSYFVATYVVAGVLWFVSRRLFRRYVATVAVLAAMGFATFALFPAAPPWLASREGELDWTIRSIGPISGEIPFIAFSWENLIDRGSEYSNPVAAVPSLHAAYTLLIAIFSLAAGAALGTAAARRVPGRDGVRPRLYGRALRRRHPAGLGVRPRRRVVRGARGQGARCAPGATLARWLTRRPPTPVPQRMQRRSRLSRPGRRMRSSSSTNGTAGSPTALRIASPAT